VTSDVIHCSMQVSQKATAEPSSRQSASGISGSGPKQREQITGGGESGRLQVTRCQKPSRNLSCGVIFFLPYLFGAPQQEPPESCCGAKTARIESGPNPEANPLTALYKRADSPDSPFMGPTESGADSDRIQCGFSADSGRIQGE
jgi:hypothetical protein